MMLRALLLGITLLSGPLIAFATPEIPDDTPQDKVDEVVDVAVAASSTTALTPEQQLDKLFQQVKENPQNLDVNFSYAKLATELGRLDEALAAYERMLIVDNNLGRVKLDMALLYIRMNKPYEAEKLLMEVLASNPPEAVQENINLVLKQARNQQRKHRISGVIGGGLYADSNANAAPTSGQVEINFLGIGFVDLAPESQAANDEQRYGFVNVKHNYTASKLMGWNTEVMAYSANNASFDNLDVDVKTIKTGPVFNMPSLRSRWLWSLGYTDTNVERYDYQNTLTLSSTFEHILHPKVKLSLGFTGENRMMKNSPTISTYALRSGPAYQIDVKADIVADERNMVTAGISLRREETQADYYDNDQLAFNVGYTHVFPSKTFINLIANFRGTDYRAPEVSINPTKAREDNLAVYGITVGQNFWQGYTATVGYQYKETDSSIINYENENERFSLGLTRQF